MQGRRRLWRVCSQQVARLRLLRKRLSSMRTVAICLHFSRCFPDESRTRIARSKGLLISEYKRISAKLPLPPCLPLLPSLVVALVCLWLTCANFIHLALESPAGSCTLMLIGFTPVRAVSLGVVFLPPSLRLPLSLCGVFALLSIYLNFTRAATTNAPDSASCGMPRAAVADWSWLRGVKIQRRRRPPSTFCQIIRLLRTLFGICRPGRLFGIWVTAATNNLIRINEGISNLPRQAPSPRPD